MYATTDEEKEEIADFIIFNKKTIIINTQKEQEDEEILLSLPIPTTSYANITGSVNYRSTYSPTAWLNWWAWLPTDWYYSVPSETFLKVELTTPTIINWFYFWTTVWEISTPRRPTKFSIFWSNDDFTWNELLTIDWVDLSNFENDWTTYHFLFNFNNTTSYNFYKLIIYEWWDWNWYTLRYIKFYWNE